MAERLLPHTHCIGCDEPIPEGQEYCSEKCEVEYKAKVKKANRRGIYFIVIVGVVIIALAFLTSMKF
jgi:predicted nucleic acid-binding Zn ribbon protein